MRTKATKKKTLHIVTTVHKDCTERITHINPKLAKQTKEILQVNKSERHIRGGMATKEKYLSRAK